jgi:transcriptional regulator with XRE-family HTH domain
VGSWGTIITLCVAFVNTFRVRRVEQRVDQWAMTFAANLKAIRIAANLTQEQLAHACGYSGQSRIGNYESSQPKARQPKPDELPRIAAALGVSVGELFGEPAPLQQSQSVRLGVSMIAETVKALRIIFARRGAVYDIATEADAAIFIEAYGLRVKMPAAVSQEDLLVQMGTVVPIGGNEDGRSNGLQVGGVDRKKAGKHSRKKA